VSRVACHKGRTLRLLSVALAPPPPALARPTPAPACTRSLLRSRSLPILPRSPTCTPAVHSHSRTHPPHSRTHPRTPAVHALDPAFARALDHCTHARRYGPTSINWVGTESGHAPYPMWYTQTAPGCGGAPAGNPAGTVYAPYEVWCAPRTRLPDSASTLALPRGPALGACSCLRGVAC